MTVPRTVRALLLLGMCSTYALASSININFSSSLLTGFRGQTVTFSASITNTTGSTVFLNSDSLNIAAPLTGDDLKFLLNAPLFVAAGVTTPVFPIFDITIPLNAPLGVYAGNFTILGGAAPSALDNIGSATFAVNVVPEPGMCWLVALASAGFAVSKRKTSRRLR